MDVFPALLEADVPFYSHEIDAYWNDIGNLDELRQGNLDALRGAVAVEPGAPEVADGVRGGEPAATGAEVAGPVLVGAGVEIGDGRPDRGPGGGRRRLPDRRRRLWCRDAILLAGAELPAGRCWSARIAGRVAQALTLS